MGRRLPPLFLTRLTRGDAGRLDWLMRGHRFDPSLIVGAAERCRFGHVRVLACAPLSRRMRPFPTTFWLACPWLIRRAGAEEANGGVRDLEKWLSTRGSAEWNAYNRIHRLLRLGLLHHAMNGCLRRFYPRLFDGLRLGGVGGIRDDGRVRVKCLHLQTASWLALGYHPGAEWLCAHGLGSDCGKQECG